MQLRQPRRLEAFARADRMAEACGTDTVEAAVKAAAAGDTRALEGLASVGRYIGIGIANMITIISPDRVVIGGGIAAAGDLLMRPIRDEVRRRVLTTSLTEVEIVTAELERGPARSVRRPWRGSRGGVGGRHGRQRRARSAS